MAAVSYDNLGENKWRVRWRELAPGPDGKPQRGADKRLVRLDRSRTVDGKEARDALIAKIRTELEASGSYESPTVPLAPVVANLERAAVAWLEWKATRCKPSSIVRYTGQMARFFAGVRTVRGIRADEVVTADVLSRDLVTGVVRGWQTEGLSESFVYNASRGVLEMWAWVADDPDNWPGVPVPPRHGKSVLPRPPVYSAPPAPTLAECDASIRALPSRAEIARRLGIVLRFTGLRLGQALALRRADIDLNGATMTVRTGKSRLEEAECRTVPVSRSLIAEMRSWAEPLAADCPLIEPRLGSASVQACTKAYRFRAAWESAVAAGEARDAVWNPTNRKQARPEHAFRAAFQAHLRIAGVAEPVIDALVGHHSSTTRARHYAGIDTLTAQMRAAVDAMPEIDWTGPGAAAGNVVRMRQ